MIHLELFTRPGGFGSCPCPTFMALQGYVIGSQDMCWKHPRHYPESHPHSCSFNVVNLSLLCWQYQGAFLLNSTLTMLTSQIATKHLKVLNVLSILERKVRKSLFLFKNLITFYLEVIMEPQVIPVITRWAFIQRNGNNPDGNI